VEELADQITKHILKQLDADHIHEIKEKSPIDPDFFFRIRQSARKAIFSIHWKKNRLTKQNPLIWW